MVFVILAALLFSACQGEATETVEVTRLVTPEVTPIVRIDEDIIEVTRLVEADPVEVTRVVEVEVTRVVTETVELEPEAPLATPEPTAAPAAEEDDQDEATPVADPEDRLTDSPAAPAAEDEDEEVDDDVEILVVDFSDEDEWPLDEFTFQIVEVRASVPITEVDHAQGGFTATWPYLSHVLAEPGKLNVGADYPQNLIDASNGAIQRTDPLNQYRLINNDYTNIGCNEGAFAMFVAQFLRLQFENGVVLAFRVPDGMNAHVYVRCPAANPDPGSDDNNLGNIEASGYRPGYAQVTHFSGVPAGGFVSEDGALQALGISQTTHSSGSTGAIATYVIGIDPYSGAYSIAFWDGVDMELVESNWWDD